MRDRRALGRDELTEQPMGQRQRQLDPGRLDPAPAGGEVPQQQHEPDLELRLARDRPQHVEVTRASLAAAEQDADDLRPRAHALDELAVEQCHPGWRQRLPRRRALDQLIRARLRRLQQVAAPEQLGDGAVGDAGLDRHQAVED
jgi:hypothetical protein